LPRKRGKFPKSQSPLKKGRVRKIQLKLSYGAGREIEDECEEECTECKQTVEELDHVSVAEVRIDGLLNFHSSVKCSNFVCGGLGKSVYEEENDVSSAGGPDNGMDTVRQVGNVAPCKADEDRIYVENEVANDTSDHRGQSSLTGNVLVEESSGKDREECCCENGRTEVTECNNEGGVADAEEYACYCEDRNPETGSLLSNLSVSSGRNTIPNVESSGLCDNEQLSISSRDTSSGKTDNGCKTNSGRNNVECQVRHYLRVVGEEFGGEETAVCSTGVSSPDKEYYAAECNDHALEPFTVGLSKECTGNVNRTSTDAESPQHNETNHGAEGSVSKTTELEELRSGASKNLHCAETASLSDDGGSKDAADGEADDDSHDGISNGNRLSAANESNESNDYRNDDNGHVEGDAKKGFKDNFSTDGLAYVVSAGTKQGNDSNEKTEVLAVETILEELSQSCLTELTNLRTKEESRKHKTDGGAPVAEAVHITDGVGLARKTNHTNCGNEGSYISTTNIEPRSATVHVSEVFSIVALISGKPGIDDECYEQYNC